MAARSTFTEDELRPEDRIDWQRVEEPPEGWRFGHRAYDASTHTMSELWTSAPAGKAAVTNTTPHKWIKCRQVNLRRYVTEWEEV